MASPEKSNTPSDEEETKDDEIKDDEHLDPGSRESVFLSLSQCPEDTGHEQAFPDLPSIEHLEHLQCKEEAISTHAATDSYVRSEGRNPIEGGQEQQGSETTSLLSHTEPHSTKQNIAMTAMPNPESAPKSEQKGTKEILYSKMAREEDTEADPPDPGKTTQNHWKQDGINTVSDSPAALIR